MTPGLGVGRVASPRDLGEGHVISERLRLGPLLRHVDDTTATIWVETEGPAFVEVEVGQECGRANTFAVHGHHYALVEVTGLLPGTVTPYEVRVDGQRVWPSPEPELAHFPPSVIATLSPGRPLRMAFGSCRVSVSHDEAGHAAHGIDALRAYALHLAGAGAGAPDEGTGSGADDPDGRPDLVLFLGDQVYADETTDEMRAFIEERRDPSESPGYELKDYEEYAHLYRLAWSEPANRWLLSTVPSAMIFDDHDIRDDWNTSLDWRQRIEATDWWHGRVVGGLASYWVHQHLGNLSPAERAEDALWLRIRDHSGPEHLDLTDEVDALADRADRQPDSYRWSFSRDFDTQARLVVVDSRAARVLQPDRRSILDDNEMAWLEERMQGGFDHLLIGTSLPYLLSPALHHLEALDEAAAEGAFGRVVAWVAEKARQGLDLEHWAAFQDGFVKVGRMTLDVASGARGSAPSTITFLSGDVHHSYVAQAWPDPAEERVVASTIVQAVCSPIRNPLPMAVQRVTALAARGQARPTGRLVGGKVPRSPLRWELVRGPWYDNNLAVLEVLSDRLRMRWWRGEVTGDVTRPELRVVADCTVG
ncbi:alkaline phosphatase D family protein [Nocardioides pantholopis]|uniref:alkaline phosphatase D family protein n=1 Tax=Nocardioides pantholopis TaxID=2483798 RepID=UPI001F498A80|nr:alkaline phosphatase D family protein [Nocardioides pantholopis]